MSDPSADLPAPPSIEVKALSYAFQDGSSGLKDVHLELPAHSRTLLIGGTYALQITAGSANITYQQTVPAKQPSSVSSPASAWHRATASRSPD